MKQLLLISLLVSGCGIFEKKEIEPQEPVTPSEPQLLQQVADVRDAYCQLSMPLYQDHNHVVNKCDGLLFAAIHNIACGWPELSPWQGEAGQWFRSQEHDCFLPPDTDNGANAQSSKDMLAGLLLNAALRGDKKRIEDFINRAQGNNWFFCEAIDDLTKISKCWLPTETYKRMADFANLQLRERSGRQSKGVGLAVVAEEFNHHLEVMGILTDGVIYGGISSQSLNKLEGHAKRQPLNTLYTAAHALYTTGDMTAVATEFLKQCPADRLPNSHDDWCSDYKYQRNQSNQGDWGTCKKEAKVIHFGTDCLFAAAVLLGEVK